MIIIQGQGVSPGVARGAIHFLRRADPAGEPRCAQSVPEEKARVAQAQAQAIVQLEALAAQCRRDGLEQAALLFDTHAMLVEDEDFTAAILEALEETACTAEQAVQSAGEQFAALFAAMDDPYMQSRSADLTDITRRIRNNLLGVAEGEIALTEPVILAADDLTPSQTVLLDRSKLLAFATRGGSHNSHTAILARMMGVPAVCALGDGLREDFSGHPGAIDGDTGALYIDPDEKTQAELDEKSRQAQEQKALLDSLRGQEDVSLDGQPLSLCCNIGSPADLPAVLANDGRGIGLFRSEFLYLASDTYPTEEEQFAAYRAVAAGMEGKRVVIRTLDIGADKQADYFHLSREANPALGLRAIRICLNRPEVFRTQLRALYRASAYGKIAILFPMITSLWEVQACKRICVAVQEELRGEGIPFNPDTELGIMIETPAAVLIAPALAEEVDFFSVGTNDLTQYTLACDRQSNELGRFFDPHHPAVLRAIGMAVEAAHAKGIWLGICGDLAADVSLLPTFLALGVDELSVPPAAVLPLRAELRRSRRKE